MRVLYDYQTFHLQRFGGISRYFRELAGRMAEVNVSPTTPGHRLPA